MRIKSKQALPEQGALYVTISFQVFEIKDKTYISDGNSYFYWNVRAKVNEIRRNAIYNAIKKEFTNRTVTPYNVVILEYYYEYFLDDYENVEIDGEKYVSYKNTISNKKKLYKADLYKIKEKDKIVNEINWEEDKNGN